MHDQTPYRDSLPVRDTVFVLPVCWLFVEHGEAESVELKEKSVLSLVFCGEHVLTAGSLGTTTMTVAMKLIMKYVRS